MAKRKNYIIDKKFQFKATFTIIGFIFVIVALMTVIIGINALDTNKKIKNIVEIEDNIVQVLAFSEPQIEEESPKVMNLQMAQNHNTNMQTLRKMITKNQILIWTIIIIVFSQGIILFFLLIRQTHRIAGPLYVMRMYMKQVLNGQHPEQMRDLRKHDLLKDFYDMFRDMINHIKNKKK